MAILLVTLCAVLLASLTVCSSQSAAEPATRLEEPQQQLEDTQPVVLLSSRSNLDFSNVKYGQPDSQQLATNLGNNDQGKDGEDMNTDELRWGWGRGFGGWGGYRRGFGWGGFGGWGGYRGWGGYGGYRGYRGYWGGGYPYHYGGWGFYG